MDKTKATILVACSLIGICTGVYYKDSASAVFWGAALGMFLGSCLWDAVKR